jgi:hypothetical protein
MRTSHFRSILTVLLAAVFAIGAMALQMRPVVAVAAETPAAASAPPAAADKDDDDDDDDARTPMEMAKTPEQRMQARFPQPIKVGDLIGQALLDGDHSTIGYVRHVVRTPDGKIRLIVSYRSWLSWAQFLTGYDVRPVAVPIEAIGSMGPALSSIDIDHDSYAKLPTWAPGMDREIEGSDVIRIAIARE